MKLHSDDNACLRSALRILQHRDHSCAELTQKLNRRGFAYDQISAAIDKCMSLGYLDDERFSAGYANELQRKGYGCRRIEQMLISKGIARQVVDGCLDANCTEERQLQSCRQALVKKRRAIPGPVCRPAARDRLYRFLMSRGFSSAVITQAMSKESLPPE